MRTAYLLGTIALLAVGTAYSGVGSSAEAQMPAPGQNDNLNWGPAPDVFPAGAQMAVLQGDPSVPDEIFTIRLRLPDGYTFPAHSHPTDEHVTVISGTFLVGMGDKFDESKLVPPLQAGGFITAPAHMNHFAMVRGQTVVQVHAMGPFAITYVNPADDPRGQ